MASFRSCLQEANAFFTKSANKIEVANMKDQNNRTLKKDDPVWITPSDGSCGGSGIIVEFTGKNCTVLCGGKRYTGIKPKNIIFWGKTKKPKISRKHNKTIYKRQAEEDSVI